MKTKIPQIVLLTLNDLGEDAACVEDFIEQLQQRIEELEDALVFLGYCTKCSTIPEHHLDEPFSSCACGTGEDYATRPLQRIQILEKYNPVNTRETERSGVTCDDSEMRNYKRAMLLLKNSHSDWAMSLSDEDERFVQTMINRAESI